MNSDPISSAASSSTNNNVDASKQSNNSSELKWSRPPGLVATRRLTLLGISLVVVGDSLFWNQLYVSINFTDYFVCTIILGMAFVILGCCLAEMTSTLPFAGGIYGFIRVTYGPYVGFLIGCCEMLQNLVYTAAYIIPVGDILSGAFQIDPLYSVVISCLYLLLMVVIRLVGGRLFWDLNTLLSILSLLVLIVFVGSSIPNMNFDKYSSHPSDQHTPAQRIQSCTYAFNLIAWFFGGIEMIPLTCGDAIKPRKTVTNAILNTSVTLFIISLILVVIGGSLSPGSESFGTEMLPLSHGFVHSLDLSPSTAAIFTLPALFVSSFSFMYIYSKQICSMAESHLLPKALQYTYGPRNIPYVAVVLGSVLIFVLLLIYYQVSIDVFNYILTLTYQASYFLYLSIPCCYLVFKRRYDTLQKSYSSPFGIIGAIYAIVVLGFATVTVLTLNEAAVILVPCFIGMFLLLTGYYYVYARNYQGFSKEEQKVLFAAYVINANRRSKHKNRKNKPIPIRHITSPPISGTSSANRSSINTDKNSVTESSVSLSRYSFSQIRKSISSLSLTRGYEEFLKTLPHSQPSNPDLLETHNSIESEPEHGELSAVMEEGEGEKSNSLHPRVIDVMDDPHRRSGQRNSLRNSISNKPRLSIGSDHSSDSSFSSRIKEGALLLQERSSFLFPLEPRSHKPSFTMFLSAKNIQNPNSTTMDTTTVYNPHKSFEWIPDNEHQLTEIKEFINTLYDEEEVNDENDDNLDEENELNNIPTFRESQKTDFENQGLESGVSVGNNVRNFSVNVCPDDSSD